MSYRRDDAKADARDLQNRLLQHFGPGSVFMDIADLHAGHRFAEELDKALDETDFLLAVIGPRWLKLLEARQASGDRDYVREEIAGALVRGIPVIPALVDDTPLPPSTQLPADIRDIVSFQAHRLNHVKFGRDVDDLAAAIRGLRGGERQAASIPWRSFAALLVLGGIGAGVYLSGITPADLIAPMAAPPPLSDEEKEARLQAMTREVQELLSELGYDPGPADGMRGVQTSEAIKAFQKDMGTTGRTLFGQVDESLISALRVAKRTKLREERQRQRDRDAAAGSSSPAPSAKPTEPAAATKERQPTAAAQPVPEGSFNTRRTAPTTDASGCILLPFDFEAFEVGDGQRICSPDAVHSATVQKIANRAIRFSQSNGPSFTCGVGETCQFAWRGAPAFRVTARSDPSTGIPPTGSLHPL